MVSPRRLLGGVAVCSAAMVLSAMLAGSANAAPNGCQNENSGANGQTCTNVGSDLYPDVVAGLHLKLPVHVGVAVNVPSCPDATAALVEAHVIVGGANGKPGTAGRLAAAKKAADAADAAVRAAEKADKAEDADNPLAPDAEDQAVIKANGELATANMLPADVPPAHAKADAIALANQHVAAANAADAKEDGKVKGTQETDAEDQALAISKAAAFDADQRLDQATKAEGKAEQGIVDAEVVIGQACKTPVVTPPAPTTDTPAPSQPVVISPALPSDGSAPTPVPVQASLPVTG